VIEWSSLIQALNYWNKCVYLNRLASPGQTPASMEAKTIPDERPTRVPCNQCGKRLFDVARAGRGNADSRGGEHQTITVSRKCPRCKTLNDGLVTGEPGRPVAGPEALAGPWHCTNCGQSLGKIDPIRGRVTTTCRGCRCENRIVAAEAVQRRDSA
jgi:hypothetical protein